MNDSQRIKSAVPIPQPTDKGAIAAYAALSFSSLATALLTGWWIISQSELLGVRFDRAYYVLLAILGLAAALMLFGAMRSAAKVQGRHLGVAFEVGGPAALFVLVILGGAWFTQPPSSFNAMIRLRYAGPENDRPAFNAALPGAKFQVYLGLAVLNPPISSQGDITLLDVPGRFRDGNFSVELLSERLQIAEPVQAQSLHFLGLDQVIELKVLLKSPPPQACGGISNARSKFIHSGDLLGDSFLLRVPPCGSFDLAAKVSDYRFGKNGPEGPENPPTDHILTVDHSVCIENGSDAVGAYMRLHINRDCGTYLGPHSQVFYVRPNKTLSDVSSNWSLIVQQIQKKNASFE